MTSKRKPIKREVGCLYRKLLKQDGKVLNLKKIIGFYEEYNNLRSRIFNSDEAPYSLKVDLHPLKMPQYLIWIKQYLI